MVSKTESIFIFGVILPCVVTVAVFTIFILCWFKCGLKEKLLSKYSCNQTNSSTTSNTNRIHYIKELDRVSYSGSRDRHASGDSDASAVHTQPTVSGVDAVILTLRDDAQHSNPSFQLDEERRHDDRDVSRTMAPSHRDTTQHLQTSPLAINRNETALQLNSLPSVFSTAHSTQYTDSQHYLSHDREHSSPDSLSGKDRLLKYNLMTNSKSQNLALIPQVHRQSPSAATSQRSLGKKSQMLRQAFQFPHRSHHSRQLCSKPTSLDNSTSSYSSSNEGDADYALYSVTSQLTSAGQRGMTQAYQPAQRY